MICKLGEICSYAKEKVNISEINLTSYISTENMLPDKNGITLATTLPKTAQTQAFRTGDVLVSNIRPYFKKIWFAKQNGGCSNDVLVFRAGNDVLPEYLYYVLSDDKFFEYAMSTSKGTKMPRGDKVALMDYDVIKPDLSWQRKITGILGAIDEKIDLNKKINKNLEEQLQAIYLDRFDPITHMATGVLSDICKFSKDKIEVAELSAHSYFSTENMQSNKAGALPASSLPSIRQTTHCHKGDVLISNIRPYFKKILLAASDGGCSTDVLCFVPNDQSLSPFLFETLYADRFFEYMVAGSKGTKMPRGDKQQIMNYPIVVPSKEALREYYTIAEPMLNQIQSRRNENTCLSALRDALLPRLMSGEIDVTSLDI